MTMRHLGLVFATVSAMIFCRTAGASDWKSLIISGSSATAAGFRFDFGDTNGQLPHVWEGPIAITDPNGRTCRVSEDVEVVHRPISLWRDRLLYVDTTSGSTSKFFVVDIRTCRISWSSPPYDGPPATLSRGKLRLTGLQPWRIDAEGLPTRRP